MNQPKRYFLDTNIFLRLFIREDEKAFLDSQKLLLAVKQDRFEACTHDLVIAEIVWTLQSIYKQSKSTAIQTSESILNVRGLNILSGYDHREALRLYARYSVKYVNACLASISEIRNKSCAIVSYDTDFKKLPVNWLKPENVLRHSQ